MNVLLGTRTVPALGSRQCGETFLDDGEERVRSVVLGFQRKLAGFLEHLVSS